MTILTSKRTTASSYREAVEWLNSLQSNASIIAEVRASRDKMNQRSLPEMRQLVNRIGYQVNDLDGLNCIHVAGTKGKGSTCAFAESILRRLGKRTGMYTSPHLIHVRERIRLDGKPLSEALFLQYFNELWTRLSASTTTNPTNNNHHQESLETVKMPTYFRFLTLLAFHVFLRERVEVTLLEVGLGGRYDATNVVDRPVVTGITSLGMDHMQVLGATLPEIAWHKAGIMKPGIPCFSVEQKNEALAVLVENAKQVDCPFKVVNSHFPSIKLGISGAHQYSNSSLAYELCASFLSRTGSPTTSPLGKDSELVLQALENANWAGRSQILALPNTNTTLYLDGAHTPESMQVCLDWWQSSITPKILGDDAEELILVFNCSLDRSFELLLSPILKLHQSSLPFNRVYFVSNTLTGDAQSPDLVNLTLPKQEKADTGTSTNSLRQSQMQSFWQQNDNMKVNCPAEAFSSTNEWFNQVIMANTSNGRHMNVLVTGSLHLVGSVLSCCKLSE